LAAFLRLIVFYLIMHGVSAQAAFFNIRSSEKETMIRCVFYLYLKENRITCPMQQNAVTQEVYEEFLSTLKATYALEYNPTNQELPVLQESSTPPTEFPLPQKQTGGTPSDTWQQPIPEAYLTFEGFQKNIVNFCLTGQGYCQKIQYQTKAPGPFQRKQCDVFCSANTCRDPFTLASCYALNQYAADGTKTDKNPICPASTVKNCLKQNRDAKLVTIIAERGWPAEWNNLEKYWGNLFFSTATEPAKGRHLGFRAAQASAVMAVLASLPFVLHVVAPAVFVTTGSWVSHYLAIKAVGHVRSKISQATMEKIKKAMRKVTGGIKLRPKIIDGCYCQCAV